MPPFLCGAGLRLLPPHEARSHSSPACPLAGLGEDPLFPPSMPGQAAPSPTPSMWLNVGPHARPRHWTEITIQPAIRPGNGHPAGLDDPYIRFITVDCHQGFFFPPCMSKFRGVQCCDSFCCWRTEPLCSSTCIQRKIMVTEVENDNWKSLIVWYCCKSFLSLLASCCIF